jgi:hypothetical protein
MSETSVAEEEVTEGEVMEVVTKGGVMEVETEGGVMEVEKEPPARGQDGTHPERRPKKIQSGGFQPHFPINGPSPSPDGAREQLVASESEVILSGQYHEVNPGQYSGQYHELGQYHEQNPGQYHEVSGPTTMGN